MAAWNMQLTKNGKRQFTRGWKSAKWVKQSTNKLDRRRVREALRCDSDAESHKKRLGHCW